MKKGFLILIIALLIILLGICIIIKPYKAKAIVQANIYGLINREYSEIKRGYYCGEGGVNCRHWEGYIYASNEIDIDAAMMRAEFHKDEDNRYTRSVNHAEIADIIKCSGGYLICYDITGAC